MCSFQLSLHPCNGQKIVTLRGEGYTERDVAAKFRCSKTVVHNAIVKFSAYGTFHDRKRPGHPRKTTPSEDSSVRQIVMRSTKSSCKTILAILCLKGTASNKCQQCFETSQQRIWTEVPQVGTKGTPDTTDEEKETGLCRRKCCFMTNVPCSSLYLVKCALGGHWVNVLTRNML